MEARSELQWKQFTEGIARNVVGPFDWVNRSDGDDSIREYRRDGTVVAWMHIYGSNTDMPGYECNRLFFVSDEQMDLCSDIAVLTDKDWAEFDFFDGDDTRWLQDRGEIA